MLSFDGTLLKGRVMDTFTIRDLRERTGELVRGAESGHLSIVTKHGRPVFVAVPFDENIIKSGVSVVLAVKLFQEKILSVGKAAKFAGYTVVEFNSYLATNGIPSVDYSPDDLDSELNALG